MNGIDGVTTMADENRKFVSVEPEGWAEYLATLPKKQQRKIAKLTAIADRVSNAIAYGIHETENET